MCEVAIIFCCVIFGIVLGMILISGVLNWIESENMSLRQAIWDQVMWLLGKRL